MKEAILDIEIHHDTCQIVAHIDGSQDPVECRNTLMEMLEGLGFFTEAKWTLSFKPGDPDPNAQWQNQQSSVSAKKKQTN
jgi:hypothetical protein